MVTDQVCPPKILKQRKHSSNKKDAILSSKNMETGNSDSKDSKNNKMKMDTSKNVIKDMKNIIDKKKMESNDTKSTSTLNKITSNDQNEKNVSNKSKSIKDQVEKSSKDELNELFADAKKMAKKRKKADANMKDIVEKHDPFDPKLKRRRTEDGFRIFSWGELKIGLGGDTDKCPFDCDCCF